MDPVIAAPCRGDALARALRASASAHHVELRMEVLGNACVAGRDGLGSSYFAQNQTVSKWVLGTEEREP